MKILTLLTDFGLEDYYVAAVKGVVLSRAPQATVVDVSHQVPPGDIAAGGFLLAAAAPTFPAETVHLAVVDPGVGSARRILVAEWREQVFVAPDNGLLSFLHDEARIRAVERRDLYREAPGHTFHGRDRFAPIAAALLNGEKPDDLGLLIDDPIALPHRPPRRDGETLFGQVVHIDRFGNLVTDLPAEWLDGDRFAADIDGHQTRRRVEHYAELESGQPAVLVGSLGTLELSLRDASLANHWRVARGAVIRITLE